MWCEAIAKQIGEQPWAILAPWKKSCLPYIIVAGLRDLAVGQRWSFKQAHEDADTFLADSPTAHVFTKACLYPTEVVARASVISAQASFAGPLLGPVSQTSFGAAGLKMVLAGGTASSLLDVTLKLSSSERRSDLSVSDFVDLGLSSWACKRVFFEPGMSVSMDAYRFHDANYPVMSSNPTRTYRYSDPTVRYTGGDTYFSNHPSVAFYEVRQNLAGKKLFRGIVTERRILNLTDPSVLKRLRISEVDISLRLEDTPRAYDRTLQIANWALSKGYRGILFPSAQMAGGVNLVIFGASDATLVAPIFDVPAIGGHP